MCRLRRLRSREIRHVELRAKLLIRGFQSVDFKLAELIENALETLILRLNNSVRVGRVLRHKVTQTVADCLSVSTVFRGDRVLQIGNPRAIFAAAILQAHSKRVHALVSRVLICVHSLQKRRLRVAPSDCRISKTISDLRLQRRNPCLRLLLVKDALHFSTDAVVAVAAVAPTAAKSEQE